VNAVDGSGCFDIDPASNESYFDAQNVPDLPCPLSGVYYPPTACGNPAEQTNGTTFSYTFTAQHDTSYTFALYGMGTQSTIIPTTNSKISGKAKLSGSGEVH
jgi:hypothetical protein